MASRKVNFNVTFAVVGFLLLGSIVFVNGILGRFSLGRFDLTEDRIYTVGDAAKRVLGSLDVPVQVKLYITSKDEMPTGLQTLERDVVDKLSEFKVASKGNLSFAVYDPSKDEDLAEKLAPKGIRPFQVQSFEKDEVGIKLVYASMGIVYKDKEEEIIPQVVPQSLATLEYDVCSRIMRLTRDSDPVVAIYSSKQSIDPQLMQLYMQMGQQPPAPQDMYTQVEELLRSEKYDVRRTELSAESPLPEEASTLLLMQPRDLTPRQRYEINKFVQRGGNLLVATQRYDYTYNPGPRGGFNITPVQQTTGIDELLDAYGVSMSPDLLMDANMEILSIPSTRNLGGMQIQVQEPVQAPNQIRVAEGQFNEEVSVTNRIGQLLFLWGSKLSVADEIVTQNNLTATPLFRTSEQAWEKEFAPGPLTQGAFEPDPEKDASGQPLAVLVTGDLPNPFAAGEVPAWSPGDSTQAAPVESFEAKESRLLVVGCAKMFDDSILGAANNATFFLNAVDALSLSEDLIAMRSKAQAQRMIEPVSDERKLFLRFFTIGLVPLALAAFGILRTLRRRQEASMYWSANAN